MANIKVRENGPLVVEGDDVTVTDWNGHAYEIARRPFVLCRCGQSKQRPFCDLTHRAIGFKAGESAAGPA
jgi:CDGSH-type Zn-finger protein